MAPLLNREEIEQTKSLAEAVHLLFGLELEKRLCIFGEESMDGEVARAYNELGFTYRKETYKRIVEDFAARVHYPSKDQKSIVDVGCGSGLLTLELAGQIDAMIIGLDLSEDMVLLAKENLQRTAKETVDTDQGKISFVQGNVYNLDMVLKKPVDYMVCRNALHRFQYPARALQQMYQILDPNGKIYIRDLRRDADWPTVIKRIGEERWKRPALVRDYIGAMAQMFTIGELRKLLIDLGITSFEITDGSYAPNQKNTPAQTMNEYASQVEYVCVIKKT